MDLTLMKDDIQGDLFGCNHEFSERSGRCIFCGKRREGAAFARNTDPDTSVEAAREMQGERATKLENLVYVTLREHGKLTTHDIVEKTGLEWNSISPRIRPLVRKGLVRDSGEREIARMGRKCILWEAIIL